MFHTNVTGNVCVENTSELRYCVFVYFKTGTAIIATVFISASHSVSCNMDIHSLPDHRLSLSGCIDPGHRFEKTSVHHMSHTLDDLGGPAFCEKLYTLHFSTLWIT